MMSDEWIGSSETLKLKAEMTRQLEVAFQKLLGVAGLSTDSSCCALAREIRKIQEFQRMLEGKQDAKQRND